MKKGQLDYPILYFAIVVIGLIILGPIILKVWNSIQGPMSASLGNVSGGGLVAQEGFDYVMNVGITFWDKVLAAAFVFSLLLLFLSAFLIDTNPFWVILYIFLSFFLILFAPDIVDALGNIYDSQLFVEEVNSLSWLNHIRVHFGEFLVGVMVLTGIIIYGKLRLFATPAKRGKGGSRR